MLDPQLLRRRALTAGLLTQVVFWCGQAASFLVLTLCLQDGRRLSALQVGVGVGGSVGLLAPGLASGRWPGLRITPLASIVMSGLDPEQAGAASSPLSTMQRVGTRLELR